MKTDNAQNNQWSHDLKEYATAKKSLEWGETPKPLVITTKIIKKEESQFNPILQFYTDSRLETQLRNSYDTQLTLQISKNKVRFLTHCSILDIYLINLLI